MATMMMSTAKMMLDFHQRQYPNLGLPKESNASNAPQTREVDKTIKTLVRLDGELAQQSQKLSDMTELKQADAFFKQAQQYIGAMAPKTKKELLSPSFVEKYDGLVGRLDGADAKHKTLMSAITELKKLKAAVAEEFAKALGGGTPSAATLKDLMDSIKQIKEANNKITPERLSLTGEAKSIVDAAGKITKDVEIAYKKDLGLTAGPSTPAPTGPGTR